ncbi:hypothetical protein EXIGLDRAFT_716671 [Exidia glandulosa HHB12029]|uniref:Uncharacterized protein n=1 Tax=Exidia glandulosa HHB12029 TaxID=1314781 RepID=A0A165ISF0_EXIGL|nr:hypothetical protein EXIGLDRAFT_716671 [Exidia glandulosa HHB12029]
MSRADPTRLPTPAPAYGFAGSEPSRSRSLSQAVPTPTTPAAVPESRPQGKLAIPPPSRGEAR